MIDDLKLAELLCTRLCHDLTGPIGAVHNGAEFLSEEGFNLQSQAVELITSSAFSAVARLQFYRMAYGRVKDHGEANLSEKQKLAIDFFTGSKIAIDWPDHYTDSAGISISVKMSRLIFNLLIVASSALIKGGTITVRIGMNSKQQKQVTVHAKGPGIKWEADNDKIIAGKLTDEELGPRNVQTYYTKRLVDELQASWAARVSAEEVMLEVTQG